MKNMSALVFTLKEFRELCDQILNGRAWIENDSSGWFWVYAEDIDEEEVNNLLNLEFGKKNPVFRIGKIYVDLTEDVVVVSHK